MMSYESKFPAQAFYYNVNFESKVPQSIFSARLKKKSILTLSMLR